MDVTDPENSRMCYDEDEDENAQMLKSCMSVFWSSSLVLGGGNNRQLLEKTLESTCGKVLLGDFPENYLEAGEKKSVSTMIGETFRLLFTF